MQICKNLILLAGTALLLCSCQSTDEAASVVVPDRDREGFTGPGIRVDNDIPKSVINEPEIPHAYNQKQRAVDGIDFFQYKHKF
jgi:hypothetical protein